MADLIRKTITSTIKVVKGKDRVLEFIGSTEVADRDNEVIKANAWHVDEYIKNPVVQWAHNYGEPPIGKTLSIRQSKKGETIFEIEFADKDTYEFADTIFKLCKGGFLNATSVGFIPREWDSGKKENEPVRTFTKVDLLEISIVPVPSNPDALITARNAGLITVKEFEFVTKPEETGDYFRVPVSGEGSDKHKDHKIRTIEISKDKGISALYCVDDKVVMTYLFDKKHDWTMAKAEAWVKDHEKSPQSISQKELKDELDFTLSIIQTVGISDELKDSAKELSNEIRRLTGGDTPVDIKSTPIRSVIAPIIKAMDEHHTSHNAFHEKVYKALKDMMECELPDGEVPKEDDKDYIREVVNQILSRRK